MINRLVLVSLAVLAPALACADTLSLRDGRVLEGEYLGGGRDTLHFRHAAGVTHYPVKMVSGLNFSPRQEKPESYSEPSARKLIAPTGRGPEAMEIRTVPE